MQKTDQRAGLGHFITKAAPAMRQGNTVFVTKHRNGGGERRRVVVQRARAKYCASTDVPWTSLSHGGVGVWGNGCMGWAWGRARNCGRAVVLQEWILTTC